jgi:hypothetical protein
MPKSREQKAAEALADGVRDSLWDRVAFARFVLSQPLPVQWSILSTIFVLIKEWRIKSDPNSRYENFSTYINDDLDVTETEAEVEAVDLSRWDT